MRSLVLLILLVIAAFAVIYFAAVGLAAEGPSSADLAVTGAAVLSTRIVRTSTHQETHMPNPYVARPSDLRKAASLHELAQGWQDHISALVDARAGLSDDRPARLRSSALDALACGAAMVQRVRDAQFVTIADALEYGATLDDVAVALESPAEDVAAGVRSWADRQKDHGLMSDERHEQVLALLPEGGITMSQDQGKERESAQVSDRVEIAISGTVVDVYSGKHPSIRVELDSDIVVVDDEDRVTTHVIPGADRIVVLP